MKALKLLFYLAIIFNAGETCGQKEFKIEDAKEFKLPFSKEKYAGNIKIPFKKIVVKDYRFDTTKLGYVLYSGIRKIIIGEKSSEVFTSMLNKYYSAALDSASENNLYIFIKTLWLQKDAMDLEYKKKIKHTSIDDWGKTGGCIDELDVFSNTNDLMTPLFRLKDNFYDLSYSSKTISNILFYPFDSLMLKTASAEIQSNLRNNKSFSFSEIIQSYSTRFDLPVLKNPIFKKGIFLSFESFKNNKPDHESFIIRKSKMTDEVYILNNNEEE